MSKNETAAVKTVKFADLQKVKSEVTEIYERSAKELSDHKAKLEELITKRGNLNARIDKAVLEAKSDDYLKAKAELHELEQIIEMHSKRATILENAELINEDQYKEYSRIVKGALDDYNLTQAAKALKILKQLEPLEQEILDTLNGGNELLEFINSKLYGNKVKRVRRYSDYSVYHLAHSTLNNGGYRSWKGQIEND